jgi:hypothetical protein
MAMGMNNERKRASSDEFCRRTTLPSNPALVLNASTSGIMLSYRLLMSRMGVLILATKSPSYLSAASEGNTVQVLAQATESKCFMNIV